MFDFKDWFNWLKEDHKNKAVAQDKANAKAEVKIHSADQLANYVNEQCSKDLKAEARKMDMPINVNDAQSNALFLFHQIGLVPDSKPMARECKHILRLRASRPDLWDHFTLARRFRCKVEYIARLERIGIEMVKEAIAKEAGKCRL